MSVGGLRHRRVVALKVLSVRRGLEGGERREVVVSPSADDQTQKWVHCCCSILPGIECLLTEY